MGSPLLLSPPGRRSRLPRNGEGAFRSARDPARPPAGRARSPRNPHGRARREFGSHRACRARSTAWRSSRSSCSYPRPRSLRRRPAILPRPARSVSAVAATCACDGFESHSKYFAARARAIGAAIEGRAIAASCRAVLARCVPDLDLLVPPDEDDLLRARPRTARECVIRTPPAARPDAAASPAATSRPSVPTRTAPAAGSVARSSSSGARATGCGATTSTPSRRRRSPTTCSSRARRQPDRARHQRADLLLPRRLGALHRGRGHRASLIRPPVGACSRPTARRSASSRRPTSPPAISRELRLRLRSPGRLFLSDVGNQASGPARAS